MLIELKYVRVRRMFVVWPAAQKEADNNEDQSNNEQQGDSLLADLHLWNKLGVTKPEILWSNII